MNKAKKNIAVFHPMQQHSYYTAKALINLGMLNKYYTSIYYNPNKLIYKILDKILKGREKEKMHSRRDIKIDSYVQTYSVLYGFLYLFASRLDKSKNNFLRFKIIDKLTEKMGKKVAKDAIRNKIDIIITYDTWAYGLIKELKNKKSNIKVIIDYTSLYPEEIVDIITDDIKRNRNIQEGYQILLEKYKTTYMKKFKYEKDNADYYISPSSVVDESLIKYNVDKEKIYRCTYGTNFENSKNECNPKDDSRIVFLYIGRMSYAKGLHYLIQAFSELNRDDFELILVGSNTDHIIDKITDSRVKYLGTLLHSEIPHILKKADIMISGSLFDGFSLSIIEGFAYNIPVICTNKTGIKDFVKDGITGYIVESKNVCEMQNKINYLLDNKQIIQDMKKNVGEIINILTWKNYEKDISEAIKEIEKKG